MGNEFLRLENKSNLDDTVSTVSFGEKPLKKNDGETNTLLNFFRSERVDFNEKLVLEDKVPVEKPKLYECVSLLIELIIISALLIYFCLSVNNLFFSVILIVFTGMILPISMVFFFYKLNTRWKIPTTLLINLFIVGLCAYLIVDVVLDRFILYTLNYANIVVPIKNTVEIGIVILIIGFVVKYVKKYNVFSVLLIACIVSAGFSAGKSMVEMFEVMFVRVQVTNGGITSAVGAIINSDESVRISIKTLLHNLLNISVFKPAIFISLAVINGFVIRYLLFRKNNEKSPLSLIFLFFFTIILMAFSSINSSILFLQVIYTAVCVITTAYALYQVVEHSIKNENYI